MTSRRSALRLFFERLVRLRLVLTQPAIQFSEHQSRIRDMARLLERSRQVLASQDVLVLPELIGGEIGHDEYLSDVRWLSHVTHAWVVGGSHHSKNGNRVINCGVVVDPSGQEVASYEKAHPYGREIDGGVLAGHGGALFEVNGLRCMVIICADFWYASSFHVGEPGPDVIIVPAFSFSQRPTPQMARARWRHAAIARAYEFAAFIGVSDWAHPVDYHGEASSGVAGLAHPNPSKIGELYRELGRHRVRTFDLDVEAQRDLRRNRVRRGFDLTQHLRETDAMGMTNLARHTNLSEIEGSPKDPKGANLGVNHSCF
jgi:predicted amidohydrolase